MKALSSRYSAVLGFVLIATVVSASEVPSGWKSTLRDDAQKVWDHCFEGGRFYPTRLISIFRQLGSQHDGDRQYEVAQLLAQTPHDPYESLLYLLQSPDPYDRGFVIQVIEHLGDRRFVARLSELSKDSASIENWDILPYKTVGEAARHALDRIAEGHNDFGPEFELAGWLRAARDKPR